MSFSITKGRFPLDIHSLMEKHPSKPAYLNEIPFDIKDKILESIDTPQHLLSMALVSKDWAALIIPNHIEYRILHAHLTRDYLWDHLSTRADLAKNIRSVRFMTDRVNEIFPVTLCPDPGVQAVQDFAPLKIIQAFQNFKSLNSLIWTAGPNSSIKALPNTVFRSVLQFQNLEELRLGQIVNQLELSDIESLRKMSSIKILVLRGNIWAECTGDTKNAFIAFLDNLVELQELTISYNPMSPVFCSCALPKLKKLHLWPEYSTAPVGENILSSDVIILEFLESHSTIEDLRWYPIGQGLPFSNGLLPALKRISTNDQIVKKLLRDSSIVPERQMQLISQISLGPNTMKLLEMIDGSHLQELHLWRFEDLDQIKVLATLVPNIRILDIPNFFRYERDTIDDGIDTLGRFPYLEHILDASLWVAIKVLPTDQMQKTINKLAAACPRLKTIKQWRLTNGAITSIVLKRQSANLARMYGDVRWVERVDEDE